MPPRYAYWTIIAGGLPTAFRTAERDELLPTFRRIKEKHPDAELKYFARGKLWASPEEARLAAEARRTASRIAAHQLVTQRVGAIGDRAENIATRDRSSRMRRRREISRGAGDGSNRRQERRAGSAISPSGTRLAAKMPIARAREFQASRRIPTGLARDLAARHRRRS